MEYYQQILDLELDYIPKETALLLASNLDKADKLVESQKLIIKKLSDSLIDLNNSVALAYDKLNPFIKEANRTMSQLIYIPN